jgi:exo-beta-1,3-glucanase (GH17 family)
MLKVRVTYSFLILFPIILSSCGFQQSKTDKLNHFKTASQLLGDSNYQAICYGGYRLHTRDSQPTLSQIKEDIQLLSALGIKILRTYNTQYLEARNILQAITDLQSENSNFEMYVMLGAWIDCENAWTNTKPNHARENVKANTAEIQRAVELANQYPHLVKIISVGNEAMVNWATSYYVEPKIILKWVTHLQNLKKENSLPKDLWITSSDNFASWGGGDSSYQVDDLKKLIEAVDYVSIHTYPMHDTHYNPVFWGLKNNEIGLSQEAKIDSLMARSLNYARGQYLSVRHYMNSMGINKPIHIGETGWSTQSDDLYGKNGSKACDEYKSAKYFQLMKAWTNQEKITCFYFEAFDEQWKDAKNLNNSENHFGLFTIEGKAKYALWQMLDRGVFNKLKRDGNPIVKSYNGNKEYLLRSVELPRKINDNEN